MQITLSKAAEEWFKDDVGVAETEYVKFHPRIYGSSPVQENFALSFSKVDQVIDPAVIVEQGGMHFVIESNDLWFFDGHDLTVDYQKDQDEVMYSYFKR
ncbi:HesB/YadR/YfhF family protein [Amphibacillus sediminis]|uniref:HesB/YadR/YfhF family protein n=1 Tax=Amphibacillus sediminis TaxID=360185 RepID=UPI0008374BF5|nr:HesB/YadR/YfhF family protein [Amphibacillus sediminis]